MLSILTTIQENRYMIRTWSKYNIQAEYIDTRLGLAWIILQPIFQTLIYTFAFGTLLGRNPRGGVPFVLFFLAGTTTWTFINNALMQSGHLIVRHINLVSQVKIDAAAIVLVDLVEKLLEWTINFSILIVIAALFGYFPTLAFIHLFPMVVIITLFTLGGMYFLASLGVFIRDIPNITSIVLRLFFFLSGVIITPDMVSDLSAPILRANPLLHMVEAIRNIVLYKHPPEPTSYLFMGATALAAFMIGFLYFRKRQGVFVDFL